MRGNKQHEGVSKSKQPCYSGEKVPSRTDYGELLNTGSRPFVSKPVSRIRSVRFGAQTWRIVNDQRVQGSTGPLFIPQNLFPSRG